MSNLIEITGEDIALLNDSDLRNLIGLLCEADFRLAELSIKGIVWGGSQDASDGGLDVFVQSSTPPPQNSFIPRNITGYQVKKSNIRPSKIIQEMQPNGILRESIKSLIQNNGAYIIVSSGSSVTVYYMKKRIDMMKEAIKNERNSQNLHLDFYDRGRIATWVRTHPSLILWVRNKIGRPLNGWKPYENWANAPGGIEEEYLLDDGLRLYDRNSNIKKGMSALDGIKILRANLLINRKSVRLTGLSGVGKTRFVQALFDDRIADNSLNRSLAFYTDMSHNPSPTPSEFAEQLVAKRTRAILIIDNCPQELHRQLTQICTKPDCLLSLLTIEYNIHDDLPEETDVFTLEAASDEVIEKLINKRFKHLSFSDAHIIAQFSGGNARVAIALSNTVEKGETLSGFRDKELFNRLFYQRQGENENLQKSAEVCSLVYSFEGTDTKSEKSEIKFLASLIDKTSSDLFRDIKTLRDRDLIQSRGVWRAILPHAIANRLAKDALESIPKEIIIEAFSNSDSERLIKSFSRRLNFLHDSQPAKEIVDDWLKKDGWLGKENCNFNDFGIDVFINIAPVSPERTLEAIEQAANVNNEFLFSSKENKHFDDFVQILWHLAYDPELFNRSVKLLCRFALSEKKKGTNNLSYNSLKSLFYLKWSGTHAPIELRSAFIVQLVDAINIDQQELGLFLLDATLETGFISQIYNYSFGARSRNIGYYPKTPKEYICWFETFISICTRLALSGLPIARKARKVLSDNLHGLWINAEMYDTIETSVKQINDQQAWNEGWIAIRGIIRYYNKHDKKGITKKLLELEKHIKPKNLLEQARTYALSESDQSHAFDLFDDYEDKNKPSESFKRFSETIRKIGSQVAQDMETFNTLLPELVSTNNPRLSNFGEGLAVGCSDKQKIWLKLYSQLEKTPIEKRSINIFIGFLSSCAKSDLVIFNSILDKLINDELLGEWLPIFQTFTLIDKKGVERLHKALDNGKFKIKKFEYLAYGRVHESINDNDLANLLSKIIQKKDGIEVVIEILKMRFFRSDDKKQKHSKSLIAVSRKALSSFTCIDKQRMHDNDNNDYALAKIAQISLIGQDSKDAARLIYRQIVSAIINNQIYTNNYSALLNSLAQIQPYIFLDEFLGNEKIIRSQRGWLCFDDLNINRNPLSQISIDDIIKWCDENPDNNYPLITSVIELFKGSPENKELHWNPVLFTIFEKAPNLTIVLNQLADRIEPHSWSGSKVNILQPRAELIQKLCKNDNEEIRIWAEKQYSDLLKTIKDYTEYEKNIYSKHDECFE
ncbi:MAG TPA: hypothetical protein PLP19_14585 [bacterium]|nr:hypothetical protein [bacterium]HPN44718.1 hypothetical protein [bacterium]